MFWADPDVKLHHLCRDYCITVDYLWRLCKSRISLKVLGYCCCLWLDWFLRPKFLELLLHHICILHSTLIRATSIIHLSTESTNQYWNESNKPENSLFDWCRKLLCDAWDEGKLFEEQGERVLGLLGGEGRKFLRRLFLPGWFWGVKQDDGRTLCFGLSWGLGDRDLGDMELGECWGELASGGDGIERGLIQDIILMLWWLVSENIWRYHCWVSSHSTNIIFSCCWGSLVEEWRSRTWIWCWLSLKLPDWRWGC